MTNSDKSNEEKRLYVISTILSEYNMLKTRFVDLVISTVLIKLKGDWPKLYLPQIKLLLHVNYQKEFPVLLI